MVADKSMMDLLGLGTSSTSQPLAAGTERTDRIQMICFLAAQGDSTGTIASRLKLTEQYCTTVIESHADEIVRMQSSISPDPKLRISRLANLALDKKAAILLSSKDEKLVNAVASDILDRSMGKAIQITENRNMNFDMTEDADLDKQIARTHQRIAQLERMSKAKPVKAVNV